ncbi:MAG: glycoside hydrolase family 30 beta sandwich domain-containing protein [Terriglobales bacterium]
MQKGATRRDFLKVAGVGAVVIANSASTAGEVLLGESSQGDSPSGELRAWVTDNDRRIAAASSVPWTDPVGWAAQDSIAIIPEKKFQPILGFGAALTDGSCLLFNGLTPAAREELFHVLFHPSEMGLNVCRTCVGSSDHSASVYSFDDGDPDPELKRFSIEHDRAYILPMLRQARQVNPELFLFSSPWSPPGWMKDNGSMLGGCMRHTYMPSYANYFVKFLQGYEAEGVPVQAITVQNEVDADQQGLMPQCFWPQDCEADFVGLHLGPQFERSGVKTKIWIIDHNYNLWGRAIAELETPGVRKYTNAVAWHGYSGKPEWMQRVQAVFPDIEMYWTEGSPDYNDPDYFKWTPWAQNFVNILQNGCRSITAWCFATDEHGHPNVGPYPLGGVLTIDSRTKDIYHSGQYWAMGHFSRFIKRGAVRIESQGSAKDLSHCAFENPDGSLVIVIANPGHPRTCEIQLNGKVARLSLTGDSVTTLTHSNAGRT